MTHLPPGQAFVDFVLGYRHTAFRLEIQERYNDTGEAEALARFLAGTPDHTWNDGWAAMIRRRTEAGQHMQRVRVVTEPHSDYARFLLDLAWVNTAAGEEIRYLPRHRAAGVDLPDCDFWLIDSSQVAVLQFDVSGALLGADLSADSQIVARHRAYREAAWSAAVPLHEYVR